MAKNDAAPAGLTSNALAAKKTKNKNYFFSAFSAFFQLFSSVLVTVNNFVCNFVRLFLLCSLTQLLLLVPLSFCLSLSMQHVNIYLFSFIILSGTCKGGSNSNSDVNVNVADSAQHFTLKSN